MLLPCMRIAWGKNTNIFSFKHFNTLINFAKNAMIQTCIYNTFTIDEAGKEVFC